MCMPSHLVPAAPHVIPNPFNPPHPPPPRALNATRTPLRSLWGGPFHRGVGRSLPGGSFGRGGDSKVSSLGSRYPGLSQLIIRL